VAAPIGKVRRPMLTTGGAISSARDIAAHLFKKWGNT
jgi:hypothetical protein